MSSSRKAVFEVAPGISNMSWRLELVFDDFFLERLLQLRRLVLPVTPLMARRDLMIDKLRARLPSAIWRADGPLATAGVERSSIVVSTDGTFSCTALHLASRVRLQTEAVAIDDFVAVHSSRPAHEVLYISQGTIDARSAADREVDAEPFDQRPGGEAYRA